jgi:hypothetical protein
MAYDVFISHSSRDKPIADAVCATLEANEIRCWIAPRDIQAGQDWPEQIMRGLSQCRVAVLVFSGNSNQSDQVHREIHHAFSLGITVIPLRLERVQPEGNLQYFIGSVHWLDALTPPLEQHLQQLMVTTKSILASRPAKIDGPVMPPVPQPAPVPVPTPAPLPPPPPPQPQSLLARVAVVAVLCGLGVFVCASALLKTLSPAPGSVEQTVFTHFPLVKTANLLANGLNLPLNVLVLGGCWMAYQKRKVGPRVIRRCAIAIAGVTLLWVLLAILGGVTAPAWNAMQAADRTTYLTNTFGVVLLPLLSLALIWFLFRRDEVVGR